MAKARKEQFEGQLRDLQKDISSLSQRLATPTIVSSHHRFTTSHEDISSHTSDVLEDINKSVGSIGTKTERGDKMAKILQEAHLAKKERDDAIYRLDLAKQEIEELRKGLQESARLKAALEHLRQDYESVKVSLESSERIRKQQKELINLLQKSHSIAVNSDSASVFSINSISTISHTGHGHGQSGADVSSASFAAENREWLKATPSGINANPNISSNDLSYRSQRRSSQVAPAESSRHLSPPVHNHTSPSLPPSLPRTSTTESTATTTLRRTQGRPPTGPSSRSRMHHPGQVVNTSSSSGAASAASTTNTNNSNHRSQRKAHRPNPSQAITPPHSRSSTPSVSVSGAGTKKNLRPRKKKNTSATPPADYSYTPAENLPSYEEILSRNISLVPHMNNDTLNTSTMSAGTASASASGNILLNQSVGSMSFADTDTSGSYPYPSAYNLPTPNYGNGANSHSNQYQYIPLPGPRPGAGAELSSSMIGKPPRYPNQPSMPTGRVAPANIQHNSTIPIYIPMVYNEGSAALSSDNYLNRPQTAPTASTAIPHSTRNTITSRTPSPSTASRRRTTTHSASASSTASAPASKKSPALVRRIPGSAAKPRSQSTPSTRPAVSTFGAASRRL